MAQLMRRILHIGLQDRLHTRLFPNVGGFIYFMVLLLNGNARRSQTSNCIGLLILISWNKLRTNFRPYRYLIGKYFIFVENAAKIQ